jgi:hypothetical protein
MPEFISPGAAVVTILTESVVKLAATQIQRVAATVQMKTSSQLALTVGHTDDQNTSGFYWEVTESTRDAAGIPKLVEIALLGG